MLREPLIMMMLLIRTTLVLVVDGFDSRPQSVQKYVPAFCRSRMEPSTPLNVCWHIHKHLINEDGPNEYTFILDYVLATAIIPPPLALIMAPISQRRVVARDRFSVLFSALKTQQYADPPVRSTIPPVYVGDRTARNPP